MQITLRRGLSWLFGLLLLYAHAATAAETPKIRSFDSGSYQAILDERQGRPFLLVLWSLDCVHCHAELELLGELVKTHRDLDLVLIATDSPADRQEIEAVIDRFGLQEVPLWVFAESASQRLRFEIDPHWYGELPRNYFFNASHTRRAKSGALTLADLAEVTSVN